MLRELQAALAASLLSLAPGAGVSAEESTNLDVATNLLLSPELRTDEARAEAASDLLSEERERKLADLSSAFVDLGLHASVQASPLRLLRSVAKIGRGVRDWGDRASVEDEALTLLEPGARSGALDDDSLALYVRLERRDSEERVAQLLADAERALGAGDLRSTRRTLDRALAIEPGSEHADRLLDEIDERAWRAEMDAAEDTAEHRHVEAWEVELAAALLVEDFERAQALGPHDSGGAELARATAAYRGGDRESALDAFQELAQGDDAAARNAAQALADPSVNPAEAFEAEVARYRTQRALGWMGGEELVSSALPSSAEALWFTRDGYRLWQGALRAWRRAIRVENLAIDAPARVWRSWQPEGMALHGAAERYLARDPDGKRASDAAQWLESLGEQQRKDPRVAPFHDGVLVLPHARTAFDRLSASRVVVAREAFETATPDLFGRIASDEDAAFALSLDTEPRHEEAIGSTLSRTESLELLARLASGLEQATLAPSGTARKGVLALLRRLDTRVRGGGVLVVSSWTEDSASGLDAFGAALVDGERSRTVGAVELERRRDAFIAERELGGSTSFCPLDTTCIDASHEGDPVFYASSDADGEVGIGARAGLANAQISLEVSMSGPHASVVIPFARWLGIARFFPVEARVGVGLDGISAGPGRDERADDPEDPSL